MKKLVTLLAGVVLAASLSTAAFAQAAGPNGGGITSTTGSSQKGAKKGGEHAPIGKKILKELNLTPDQNKQVQQLVKDFEAKRNDLTKSGAKPDKKQMAALRKQFQQDFLKVLTPDQVAKLKELREQASKNRKNNPNKGGTTTTNGGSSTTKGGGI